MSPSSPKANENKQKSPFIWGLSLVFISTIMLGLCLLLCAKDYMQWAIQSDFKQAELNRLQSQVQGINSDIEEKKLTLKQQEELTISLKSSISQLTSKRDELQAANRDAAKLNSQNQEKNYQLTAQIESKQTSLSALQAELQQMGKEKMAYNQDITAIKTLQHELQQQESQQRATIQTQGQTITRLKKESEELQAQIQQTSTEFAQQASLLSNLQALKEQITQAQGSLDYLNSNTAALQEKATTLQRDIAKKEAALSSLDHQEKQLVVNAEKLASQAQSLEILQEQQLEAARLRSTISAYKEQITNLLDEQSNLNQDIAVLHRKNMDLTQKNASLRESHKQSEKEQKELELHIATLKDEMSKLQARTQIMQQTQDQEVESADEQE